MNIDWVEEPFYFITFSVELRRPGGWPQDLAVAVLLLTRGPWVGKLEPPQLYLSGGSLMAPADLAKFWADTIQELARTPMNPSLEEVPEHS